MSFSLPVILPSILPTENGDYAVMRWIAQIDPEIQKSLQVGEPLCCYAVTGMTETPYGALTWFKCCLDTLSNFRSSSSDLFWFDFIPPPVEFPAQWLAALHKQANLQIAIPIQSEGHRLNKLLDKFQLEQYLTAISQAQKLWHSGCNYPQALKYLLTHVLSKVESDGMEAIALSYAKVIPPAQILTRCLKEAAVASGVELEVSTEDLELLGQQKNLNDFLSSQGENIEADLIKDWLFANLCVEHSQLQKKQLQIACGISETGKWTWINLPYASELEVLFSFSKTYRYLLRHNWKRLLTNLDVVVGNIELPTIAELGKVPHRAAFQQTAKILTGALLDRSFGIDSKTAILIGKKGLEEIEFLPLANAGAKCLFVVRLTWESIRKVNLCLVGEIDAAAGKIQARGVKASSEVELILFCVAIAYRDLLVARDVVSIGDVSEKNQKSKKHRVKHLLNPIRLVARIYRNSSKIDDEFACPEKLVARLKKYSPYIRSCHLRKLPEGHEASPSQLEIAAGYQFLVPQGFTFVRSTTVGGEVSKLRDEFRSISLLNLLF